MIDEFTLIEDGLPPVGGCVNYQLIEGDCLEVLPTLKADSIDLTVTSPPYDNLRTYGKDFDAAKFDWRTIIKELYRVTKVGGVVVWVVSDATIKGSETGTSFRQALWAMECGFNLHDTMIYAKPNVNYPDFNRYYQCFEYMFVWSKQNPTFNPIKDRQNRTAGQVIHGTERNRDGSTQKKSMSGGIIPVFGVRYNIWSISNPGKAGNQHPAPFPESLARDHILSWSNVGDTVFDPMMGSGTTGKMAMLTNRRFIGIELDPGYFAIAQQRIEDVARQARGEFRTITDNTTHEGLPLFAGI